MTEQLDAGLVAEQVAESGQLSSPDGGRELGRARKRKEDAKLITGQTTWTDNIQMPGMAHMTFLRSPMAHARINSIDVSPALERPGVFAAAHGQQPRPVRCAAATTSCPRWWKPGRLPPAYPRNRR